LKVQYDEPLSNFAYNVNVRPNAMEVPDIPANGGVITAADIFKAGRCSFIPG